VFNLGGLEPISLRDLVDLLITTARSGRYRFVEWPPEKKAIDIGDFYADSTLIRETLGWQPRVPLQEGLARTLEFYRAHFQQYVNTSAPVDAL
jgi:UDP-glucose 4-epimerase